MIIPRFHKLIGLMLWGLFAYIPGSAQVENKNPFPVQYHVSGEDTSFIAEGIKLQTIFTDEISRMKYINGIPASLLMQGFPLASVDSIWNDANTTHVVLYRGTKFSWLRLNTHYVDDEALSAVGYQEKLYTNKPFAFSMLTNLQEKLLKFYESRGYPFAAVFLDSVKIENDNIAASLRVDSSVLYHIDSMRIIGDLKISRKFLQRFLDIENGSVYNREKLMRIDKRISDLAFVKMDQPSDVLFLGSGAVVNLYVQPKKSSQVNAIVGFLPASGQEGKLQVTADVNLNLQNLLGNGENILIKWQQLQQKSPRLNLGFSYPYIFNSPFGVSFLFDLFKKDSSFLQLNAQAGLKFDISSNQAGKLFLQWQSASLLEGGVDTLQVKLQKKLPVNIDVKAVNAGLDYEWIKTDYRYNPRSGTELTLETVTGIKTIKPNNNIINLKDNSFNYAKLYDSLNLKSYQLRVTGVGAHYFPLGKQATLKASLAGGYYNSPTIFRNELFQIGGYKLLRGFDEESIYSTRYAVITAEYRYLVGTNSFLFLFTDVGFSAAKYRDINTKNQFTGAGLGIRFETKAGLLNLSYAAGKRNDLPFNIRQASKLHFGYINYF